MQTFAHGWFPGKLVFLVAAADSSFSSPLRFVEKPLTALLVAMRKHPDSVRSRPLRSNLNPVETGLAPLRERKLALQTTILHLPRQPALMPPPFWPDLRCFVFRCASRKPPEVRSIKLEPLATLRG
jgi:hypothetical protein